MSHNELQQFITVWNVEAEKTTELLRRLPTDKYDFRPDAGGRSLGELAWHLAEGDAYFSYGIDKGGFVAGEKPPGIARPRKVEELAPGYARIHQEAVDRIKKLDPADLNKSMEFFGMPPVQIRDILWNFVLHHGIHHRGQLSLMCRLAGGTPNGMYGPSREEMPKPAAA